MQDTTLTQRNIAAYFNYCSIHTIFQSQPVGPPIKIVTNNNNQWQYTIRKYNSMICTNETL